MSKPLEQIKIKTRKDIQGSCGGRRKGSCGNFTNLPYMKIAA